MNDREKLIKLIEEAYSPVMGGYADEEKVRWLAGLDIYYNWEDVADHLIANGVVIQKQGEWVYIESYPWVEMYRCSECGYETDDESLTDYCPNCGAKMKEVK